MENRTNSKRLIDIISYLFVLLFLYVATSKLVAYDTFQLQISKSPIITDFAHILVWMIPSLEIIIAIMLLVQRTVIIGLYASTTLMLIFTTYILIILNYEEHIPCSCGGVLAQMDWPEHLVFNIAFVILGLIGIYLQSKQKEKSPTQMVHQ